MVKIYYPPTKKLILVHRTARNHMHKLNAAYNAMFRLRPTDFTTRLRTKYADWVAWLGAAGRIFTSATHAWESLKATNKRTFKRFCRGGDFAEPSREFFDKVSNDRPPLYDNIRYDRCMRLLNVGDVPEIATNGRHARNLSINRSDLDLKAHKDMSRDDTFDLMLAIQRQKFEQNPVLKVILLATGTAYLVNQQFYEFTGPMGPPPKIRPLTASVGKDGSILGDNITGLCLMQVRSELAECQQ